MIETDKNYWLYIASHVYCCVKNKSLLLYNTKNGTFIESSLPEIIDLIQSLHERCNLGAIDIAGGKLMNTPYQDFVEEFCKKSMGNIMEATQVAEKPIQLMPVLNLQRDIERLQKDSDYYSTGEGVLHYLLEINLYVNQVCGLNCPFCDHYFRQSLCCTKNNQQLDSLSLDLLKNVFKQVKHAPVGKINILGGNILQYPYLEKLHKLVSDFKERAHIWVHYANIANYKATLLDFQYVIPVTFPVDKKLLMECVIRMKDKSANYCFFTTNKDEINQFEQLIKDLQISNYTLHPVYTKDNIDFFEELVYLDKGDVFCDVIPFRRIFAQQKLNSNFFGSLTILSDGDVYANVNKSVLGNIKTASVLDIIDQEMHTNTAWRVVREAPPCNQCLYQYLCPPPSNYEIVIDKPNLCHVKP